MSDRCEFTEIEKSSCAHCRNTPRRRAELPTRQGWFEARYPGQCANCGGLYSAGAHITFDEGTGRWIAECCNPDGGEW